MASPITSFFSAVVIFLISVFSFPGSSPKYPKPTGLDVFNDISYGEEETQKFDLIIPQGIGKDLSLSIYLHGGAWLGGDKSLDTELVLPMAQEKGMISANVNYRLLSESRSELDCRTMLQDIDDAIKKIVEVCEEKGYSVNKAIIWGKSAGGHLALMYAYTCKDTSAVDIGLVYSICGPTDMTDENFFAKTDFTTEQMLLLNSVLTGEKVTEENLMSENIVNERKRVSPINYVNASSVPTIFNSCGRDRMVPASNAERLEKVLKEYGVDHYYAHFSHSNHCGRNGLDFFTYTVLDYHLDRMIKKYVCI